MQTVRTRAPRVLTAVLAALVTGITLLPATTATASPAGRAPGSGVDGTLYGRDGTLWQGCRLYDYGFDLRRPSAASWRVEVTVRTPRGSYSDSVRESGTGSRAASQERADICDDEGAGRYSLQATATWFDRDGDVLDNDRLTSGFRLSRRHTRTVLRVDDPRPAPGSAVTFTSRSREATPAGTFQPFDFEYTHLEIYDGTAWRVVPDSRKVTDDRGRARWRLPVGERRELVRAVTERSPYSLRSRDRVAVLPRR